MTELLKNPAILLLLGMNVLAFILMGIDKLFAKCHARRISEKTLLSTCALFGAAGGLLGMLMFRHKIRKPRFKYGIPLLIFLQVAVIALLYYFL